MISNYLKVAVRNITKHKTHALINIFGLAVAFVCSVLLFINAQFELSYDSFHEDKERIFKLYNSLNGPEGEEFGSSMGYPVLATIKSEIPEIASATRYMWSGNSVEYNGKKAELSVNLVEDDFFKVFTFPLIDGNKVNPLGDLGNAVISEHAATVLFNKESPIGKTIKVKIDGEYKDLIVSAVAKDFPKNSSISFDVLARPELRSDYAENKNEWNNQHHEVYVKLASSFTQEQAEFKLRQMVRKYNANPDTAYSVAQGWKRDRYGDFYTMKMIPISQFHFHPQVGSGGDIVSKNYIYTILLISLFIMVIACFNFVNLNVARAFTRAKEVGVRKCLGAGRAQIFMQIWGESLLICFIAFAAGIALALLLFPAFNDLFNARVRMDLFLEPQFIIASLACIVLVSLFAGAYPALTISSYNTSGILKGSISVKRPGIFRNSLIVVQFTMACLLMGCTIIAYNQFQYMRNLPLGIDKESVVSIPLSSGSKGRTVLSHFRERLANRPDIISVSGSSINIGLGKDGSSSKQSNGFGYKDKQINTNWLVVDYDFLKTMGIKLKSGRDFSRDFAMDTTEAVVVTESMAKQFGEKNPLEVSFSTDSTRPNWKIVGIIPDFHLYSAHEETEPLTISLRGNSGIHYAFIKTKTSNPVQTMKELEKLYKELVPEKEFRASFMDENTDRWYNKEKGLSLLLAISSLVAIILSCLGLFALALLMIQQRVKEIGVRKVLGASIFNINQILVKEFLKLVILSVIISTPLSWWLMNKWLMDFPYHTTISWLVFAGVGLTAIIVSLLTVSYHTVKASLENPVKNLRTE